jgi:hypothetical protein
VNRPGPERDPFETDDGAYLIGALSPTERAAYEAHLRGCPSCTHSLAELVGLPGLLARVPADVAATLDHPGEGGHLDEPPPPGLLADVLDRVDRLGRRKRRRRRVLAAASVAAAAVLVGVVLGTGLRSGGSPVTPPSAGVELAAVTTSPLAVTAQLTPVRWGTRVTLLCSYPGETSAGSRYAIPPTYVLVLRDSRGVAQQVATWKAVPGRLVTVQAATALSTTDIAAIEVRTADGRPVLRSVN